MNKHIISFFSVSILLILASEEYGRVGVKKGDWAKYDAHFSQDIRDFNRLSGNHTTDYDFLAIIDVLVVAGNNVTFKHIMDKLNGSQPFQQTLTANPTEPYNTPPQNLVHIFFIPAGLSRGDRIPQPTHTVNSTGDLVFVPFSQVINETVSRNFLGVIRQANHIKWNRTSEGISGDGTWIETIEKNDYYDRETGLLMDSYHNSSKIYYTSTGKVRTYYHQYNRYVIKECSIFGRGGFTMDNWILYIIAGGSSSVVVIAALFLRRRFRTPNVKTIAGVSLRKIELATKWLHKKGRLLASVVLLLLIGSGIGYSLGLGNAPLIMNNVTVQVKVPSLSGEVKLGAIAYGGDMDYLKPAMDIALEEVNNYTGKLGLNVTFSIMYEEASFDADAVEKYQSLAERGAEVILGMWISSQVEACKEHSDEHQVVTISSGSTAPSLAAQDYIFRLVPNDVSQARALARMMESKGVKAAVIIHRDDTWGNELVERLGTRFQELGGEIAGTIAYSTQKTNFSSVLSQAAEKVATASTIYGQEHVSIEVLSFSEINSIISQVAGEPSLANVRWFGTDGFVKFPSLVKDYPQFSSRAGFYSPLVMASDSSRLRNFANKFINRTGLELRHYEPESYDSVWVTALAILQAEDYNADKIAKVLPDVCASYYGASGWLKLDMNGDKENGDYDIWAVIEKQGAIDWEKIGVYNYREDNVTWYFI